MKTTVLYGSQQPWITLTCKVFLDVSSLRIVSLTSRSQKSYVVSLVKQAKKTYFLSFPISSSNDLSDCEERAKSRAREEGDTQRAKENVFHLLLAFLVA